jgi:RNA polymerase sigma-70 factor, ECF subfamily
VRDVDGGFATSIPGGRAVTVTAQAEGSGQPTDEALVVAIAAGDASALGALYDRYGSLAYGLAIRMMGDRDVAEDVVQETFVSVWRHAADFDPRRGTARAWLLTSIRHRCIDLLRGPRSPSKLDAPVEAALAVEAADDVWESVLRTLQAQDVRRALDRLPEEQRTTIHLAFFGGLTHTQIASQMAVPLGTVKGRMRLALDKLREMLLAPGELEPATEG